MIYGAILAGGVGSRMKSDLPKQFLPLGDRPIIVHTIEKFLHIKRFDKVYLAIRAEWKEYLTELLKAHNLADSRLCIVEGGSDRNSSLLNVIAAIRDAHGIGESDVLISHDAVRPFVTERIINDNIDAALEFGTAGTAIPSVDTILESHDGRFISSTPPRERMYQAQTPQSFNIKLFTETFGKLTAEQIASLTDACKIFTFCNINVRIVEGSTFNLKITTNEDYKIAQMILSETDG